jgi:NAD(P)H-quinone oxidoreductase subunit 5
MGWSGLILWVCALAPAVLLSVYAVGACSPALRFGALARALPLVTGLSAVGPLCAALLLWSGLDAQAEHGSNGLRVSAIAAWVALLVQLLATVIASFSLRYLRGEPFARKHLAALAAVIAAVQWLLLADHWLLVIPAWALVGFALQPLLCFYPDRPFALLAAHKKRVADRLADLLLIAAAAAAWIEVGSGSLSDLRVHLTEGPASALLQASAVFLALAVVLRTALFPVHGWLIQVMEAPTPVSALLHAGVVNLGGFLLIRFAPLLEQAPLARWLLIFFGLMTAVLAGFVMLTRVSIKVRLAWSTVAQMGFMILECGLGLYTFAALHLIGHSLYKAQAFLSAADIVRQTRIRMMTGPFVPAGLSLLAAPALVFAVLLGVQWMVGDATWPLWWLLLLALAWAPLLWWPAGAQRQTMQSTGGSGLIPHRGALPDPLDRLRFLSTGLLMVALLSLAIHLLHALPLQLADAPDAAAGWIALAGLSWMYLCLITLQARPLWMAIGWRWSYAGFYVDELFTRFALRIWPVRWTVPAVEKRPHKAAVPAVSQTAPRCD